MTEDTTAGPGGVTARRRQRTAVVVAAGLGLVLTIAVVAMLGEPAALMAVPLGLAGLITALASPFSAYVAMLTALSLVPVERRFLAFFVPNWLQLMMPALIVGILLHGLRRRASRTFAVKAVDLPIAAFVILGYVGVRFLEGPDTIKFYTNQQVVPIMMYFAARWLPLDRRRFRVQLRFQLLGMLALSLIMLGQPLFGFDPFYHGFHRFASGGMARGPMWSISDTVAYTAIWPAFFLYALATRMPLWGRPRQWLWGGGLVLSILATAATTERTGPAAVAVALLACCLHPRMARYVATGAVAMGLLLPLWLVTPSGRKVAERMSTVKQEGNGFERRIYRKRALDYLRSPYWNPVLGTGFGRITTLSLRTMPDDEWVYDYNWQDFRQAQDFSSRPVHCAPLTVLSEYGYAGVTLLLLAAVGVFGALAGLPRLARRKGVRLDVALVWAALGALGSVLLNGLVHNTESVVEVLICLWAFAGTVVGHPDIFLLNPEEDPQRQQQGPPEAEEV